MGWNIEIMVNHNNDELANKILILDQNNASSHVASIPPVVEKSKVDSSISCID